MTTMPVLADLEAMLQVFHQEAANFPRSSLADGRASLTDLTRFYERLVIQPDQPTRTGCWIWTGSQTNNGYGLFAHKAAHRWSYETFIGETIGDRQVHHRCLNPACVRPSHLAPLTAEEHQDLHSLLHDILRPIEETLPLLKSETGIRRRCPRTQRIVCRHGHLMTPENTWTSKTGQRVCRQCRGRRVAEYHERRKSAYRIVDSPTTHHLDLVSIYVWHHLALEPMSARKILDFCARHGLSDYHARRIQKQIGAESHFDSATKTWMWRLREERDTAFDAWAGEQSLINAYCDLVVYDQPLLPHKVTWRQRTAAPVAS